MLTQSVNWDPSPVYGDGRPSGRRLRATAPLYMFTVYIAAVIFCIRHPSKQRWRYGGCAGACMLIVSVLYSPVAVTVGAAEVLSTGHTEHSTNASGHRVSINGGR